MRVLEQDWGVKEDVHIAGRTRTIMGWFEVLKVSKGYQSLLDT